MAIKPLQGRVSNRCCFSMDSWVVKVVICLCRCAAVLVKISNVIWQHHFIPTLYEFDRKTKLRIVLTVDRKTCTTPNTPPKKKHGYCLLQPEGTFFCIEKCPDQLQQIIFDALRFQNHFHLKFWMLIILEKETETLESLKRVRVDRVHGVSKLRFQVSWELGSQWTHKKSSIVNLAIISPGK